MIKILPIKTFSQLTKRSLLILFLLLNIALELKAQTWNLLWSDEFSGTSINRNNWNFETGGGGWGNNELENYTNRPENAVIKNDQLLIIARKESYNGSSYTSSRLTSQGLQNFTYGKIEASIKIPVGQGIWPAFWMLGKNISTVNWPTCGEIDIMEHINSNNILYGTIHWNNNGAVQYGGNTTFNTSQYHTYGIEWDSTAIRWYLDGTKYAEANIANNINNTGAFHQPFFFILNLAVGGTWPGNPDATTSFPDTMYVDYVRVYQQSLTAAPSATITSSGVNTFCSGDSLVLNANTGAGYTYQWNKGSTAINGATGIKYTAKTSGSYSVTVTSGTLSTTSSATTVTVNTIPIAPTSPGPATYCQNVTATALTATGTALKWYTVPTGGTGNATAPTPATINTGTINFYVSQTINTCESPRALIAVTVNSTPSIPTVNQTVTYCQGATATALTATGTALKWYTVPTGGAGNATAPIPATINTGTINFYVSQTINVCESPKATIAVTVNALPIASITPASSTFICIGESVQLNANTGSGLNYQWSRNGTSIIGANSTSYNAVTSGTYVVNVTNSNNCLSTSSAIIITVSTSPAGANAGADQHITTTTTQLAANIPSLGTGAWSVISGTAIIANINSGISSVNGLGNGANVLKWTISNGTCPSTSSTVTINVGTVPNQQTITGSSHVNTNSVDERYSISSNSGSTYHWSVPPGAVIISANTDSSEITVTFGTGGGNISVIETNSFGSTTDVLPVTVSSATGLSSIASTDFYEIYPNPFSEYSTIIVHSRNNDKINITVSDVQGTMLFTSSDYTCNQKILLGDGLPKGLYFVRLLFGSEIKVLKLIKL